MLGADPRRALVLYGRVATYGRRAQTMSHAEPGNIGFWRTCAQTIEEQVLKPWRLAGKVDIFVQSWNAGEIAAEMNARWQPAAFYHALQNDTMRCPVQMRLCERTMWSLLGMKRALELRRLYAAFHGISHAAVLVMRHDVYWRNSLPPLRTDGPHIRLWLSFDCEVNYCREGPQVLSACKGRYIGANETPPPWMVLKHSKSAYFGVPASRCESGGSGNAAEIATCMNTVLIDWWAVMLSLIHI